MEADCDRVNALFEQAPLVGIQVQVLLLPVHDDEDTGAIDRYSTVRFETKASSSFVLELFA